MYYCDDIEADPMAWEERMFDEAEEYYRIEEERNAAYEASEEYHIDESDDYMDEDVEEFSKEWYELYYGDYSTPYENWKEYHDWLSIESEEKVEWLKFCNKHRFNITYPCNGTTDSD